MIDGITILNEVTISGTNIPVFLTVCLILMVVAIVVATKYDNLLLAYAIAFIGVLCIALPISSITSDPYTQYECLIDKSVSMTEVYEKYEVVEQRGDIWVLEDKE